METPYTPDEQRLIAIWERHLDYEFVAKDATATVATMTPENDVNHVPVMTGGRGAEQMREFYGRHFIPKMPADMDLTLISRTVGQGRIVDEHLSAREVLDPTLPSNELIRRAEARRGQ